MRKLLVVGLTVLLAGCSSERHFVRDTLWPFGDPNAPQLNSESAQLAIGHKVAVTPLQTQPGDVWPGPVQPMPSLSDIQAHANLPLGQTYQPSLPSPYPPGQEPVGQSNVTAPPPAPASTTGQ